MKQSIDLAKKFLLLASRDRYTLKVLLEDIKIADETIGFHAQQAVEKCLKTVLILHGVEFRKTHALDELLDLLKDKNLSMPENEEQLEYLTPYAVLWRYDFDSSESLARENTVDVVNQVYKWAENHIALVYNELGNE